MDIISELLYEYDPIKRRKNFTKRQAKEIKKYIEEKLEPEEEEMIKAYQEIKKRYQQTIGRVLQLEDDGRLFPLPRQDGKTDRIYITGPSESGKSTYAANFIKRFKIMYPDKKFFIFSRLTQDEVLDKLNPIRVSLDESYLEDPLNLEDLSHSIVLFDDIDTIGNKHVREKIKDLRDDCLETGRHNDIAVISVSHVALGNKNTKMSLNESNSLVLFPKAATKYHIESILTRYIGLDKHQINYIYNNIKSRWIAIYRDYPMFILHENGAYFP